MNTYRITAALLAAAIVTGCGSSQNTQNTQELLDSPTAEDAAGTPVSPVEDTASAATTPLPPASAQPTPPRAPAAAPKPAPAPAPPPAPRVEYRTLAVPAGTALSLELLTPLSSDTSALESPVRARLTQAVAADGYTVLPAGTELTGVVTDVAQAGRVKGRSRVTFAFTEATVAGARETVRTAPFTFEGEATKSEDATKIGAGAGIGAVIGGILGGGSGAAKGAAIGGAAGTGVVLATRGEAVEVAAGTSFSANLSDAFETRVRVE